MKPTPIVARRDFVACAAFALGVVCTLACVYVTGFSPYANDVVLKNVGDEELKAKLAGSWVFDDLRTDETEQGHVVFDPSGIYRDEQNDAVFRTRWFTSDSYIYFVYRRVDGVQDDGKDHVFRVVPQFDDTGTVLTIAFRGDKPHGKLRRVSKS